MEGAFRFLKLDNSSKWPKDYQSLFGASDDLKHTIFGAINLAESAELFFRGLYPIETATFPWGKALELPWHSQYWKLNKIDTGEELTPNNIEGEIKKIVIELSYLQSHADSDEKYALKTYASRALTSTDQLIMQGLAVETMLGVDNFLSCLNDKKIIQSLPWLTFAHSMISECCCHAQSILGTKGEIARAGGYARHAKNRGDKEMVFRWCDENMHRFKSMDDAAFDIAGTFIPQKFRAVREWMTDWKKLRSASTP